MCWRQPLQRIRQMENPDLRARGIDPVRISRLVMHEQIRLQGFDQTADLRTLHFRVHRGARESKRSRAPAVRMCASQRWASCEHQRSSMRCAPPTVRSQGTRWINLGRPSNGQASACCSTNAAICRSQCSINRNGARDKSWFWSSYRGRKLVAGVLTVFINSAHQLKAVSSQQIIPDRESQALSVKV